ncbi:GNAT family N-acetyltransferase [Sulfurimonas aquatica]|uniref:GNAT family N-acetyltransferase n=1 Tax=Sulfurimonas aquatica TaxID=2672570 RepID=UPI001A9871B2|nr:GNAT family N-acetyltransferase [Sulfurimonas aquatica]
MNYNFSTNRLIVKEWHSYEPKDIAQPDLVKVVENILVPEVTKTFPIMWRGKYDTRRAKAWIQEQDSDSKTLLAVERETKKPIGLINFFNVGDKSRGTYLRLGYMLSKVMWDQGFATEFVEGFIHWCKENKISTILARVEPDNIASIRVLEKNNFSSERTDSNGISLLFEYNLLQ